MEEKQHHKIKRKYKKIAAAIGSAAILAATAIPSVAAASAAAKPSDANPSQPPPPPLTQQVEHAKDNQSSQKTDYEEVKASQPLSVTATAYAPGPHDNDQWGNKTRMGTEIRPGVIAVDPKIIPLGSKVMIKYPDGTKAYATAEDTGGAIKGNRIDVAKSTVQEANKFGFKAVKLYILSSPKQENQQKV